MEAAEAAHLWAMVLTVPYFVALAAQFQWAACFWFVLVNVIVNVYPALHLRRARGRVIRTRDREVVIRSRRRAHVSNA